jgi:hypothetical protein
MFWHMSGPIHRKCGPTSVRADVYVSFCVDKVRDIIGSYLGPPLRPCERWGGWLPVAEGYASSNWTRSCDLRRDS